MQKYHCIDDTLHLSATLIRYTYGLLDPSINEAPVGIVSNSNKNWFRSLQYTNKTSWVSFGLYLVVLEKVEIISLGIVFFNLNVFGVDLFIGNTRISWMNFIEKNSWRFAALVIEVVIIGIRDASPFNT